MTICDMLVSYPIPAHYSILQTLPVIYEQEEEDDSDISLIEEDTLDLSPTIIVPPLTYILIN